ncbi:serine palmitoyltransferase [Litorimonas taeanensis]|uniref:Serine palmitoyltransferase n=1 Tax=Litorimonas taeanensis TaxID=568099 RepID=A0A420WKL9_9PROT|nr:aminotransferase class I/II-fold pyridoxal phosphate-dependent enzyme [Litorimonas taeanensis]RKQ71558.1 serine palmitoyltransferase [Litorimonas taeanensis]
MSSIFDKYSPLKSRVDMMMKIGRDALGVQFDDIINATRGRIGNREILLAGTNNYLGLTFDEDCVAAAKQAIDNHGTGTTGSRVANGSYAEHVDLEKALADHFGMPSCVVFTTGYQTNLSAISALAGDKDVIFMDADAHACIIDGTRLTGASTFRFRHNSPEDLDKRLSRHGDIQDGHALVVIEGMYSMFGDIAPVDEFVDVTHRHGGYLFIDEAHSYGIFGETGCGIAEEQGVLDQVDFISGTFSKSLASVGGFCASKHPEFEITRKVMRPYMFTASATPSNISAARAAVEKVKTGDHLRKNLKERAQQLHAGLSELGYDLCADPSPVIAARRPNEAVAALEWNWLLENGVYVNLAVPPGTPQSSSLLRISLSAAHTEQDVNKIVETFGAMKNAQGEMMNDMASKLAAE